MPTYALTTSAGSLSIEQKKTIVKSLTEAHHDVALAPRFFVQVVFYELPHGSHFIGGEPANPGHIWVRADIRAGRTQDQKTRLLNRILAELSEIARVPREDIWVYLSDIPGPSIAEFGHPLPQPGEEEAWLAKLPPALQEKLRARA